MTLTNWTRELGAALVLGAVPGAASAAAQDVAGLYGPQPPANATYVRVVNLAVQPARITLPGSEGAQALAAGASTRLSVVTPGTLLRVTVDGHEPAKPATATDNAGAASASDATAGQAITVVLTRDAQGWRATRVANPYERLDAMRATLRVYNVAGACAGKVAVADGGATVFAQVPAGTQQARAINPIAARLTGSCGATTTMPLQLPPLAAGDSYSLFLAGDAAKPVLIGTRDELAWPPAKK
ncbi:alginate O-acetyltransferase AlgF (plasmid) [Ralstonia sp. 25C]|uniref:alginate O-acetyltransferase AlgF n=1 Tax=Ralstonia sp. 25C TaxID=3447363 RepID=UPI003F74CC17